MSKEWEIEGFLDAGNDGLRIDGIPALELAQKYGTPLFVYSEPRIRSNIRRLQKIAEAIPVRLKICYAAKACSTMAILRAVKDAGCDLEVNSGGELWKAFEIGFEASQIIFNGTSKEVWEIENAINTGIYAIQVDSVFELALIEKTAKSLRKKANVSLRLVPEIETNTHSGLQTALVTSKFGMMPDEALSAFKAYKGSENLDLAGIHLHIGSQNPDAAGYAEAAEILFRDLLNVYNETGIKLSHINLGGGFPVNYLRDTTVEGQFPGEQREMFQAEYDPADAVANAWSVIRGAAEASNASHLIDGITLLIEPGRFVVADAAVCLTTVRNKKERPASTASQPPDVWLLTDAGFNLLLSMETYKWYYHLISAARPLAPHDVPYKLAGPLCDGGDVYFDIEGMRRLPNHRLLPTEVEPGEVLALLNAGAYTLAQASQYNGRFLPPVVLIDMQRQAKLVRKADTFKDLVSGDIY